MTYIKMQIEAKEFTIEIMLENVSTFGGESQVKRKVELLRFEVMQLKNMLDSLH